MLDCLLCFTLCGFYSPLNRFNQACSQIHLILVCTETCIFETQNEWRKKKELLSYWQGNRYKEKYMSFLKCDSCMVGKRRRKSIFFSFQEFSEDSNSLHTIESIFHAHRILIFSFLDFLFGWNYLVTALTGMFYKIMIMLFGGWILTNKPHMHAHIWTLNYFYHRKW